MLMMVVNRINYYMSRRQRKFNVSVFNNYNKIRIREIALTNINIFETSTIYDENEYELNFFKALLVINDRYDKYEIDFNKFDNIESIADMLILHSFQFSDIYFAENSEYYLKKLIFANIYKAQLLLKFLDEYKLVGVKKALIHKYNSQDESEFLFKLKYIIFSIFIMKQQNGFIADRNKWNLEIIEIMTLKNISDDEDFYGLKVNPVFHIDEKRFSYTNYFYAVDFFYKGLKINLKNVLENDSDSEIHNPNQFITTNFSEKFLMKNILDDIFESNYYTKIGDYGNEKDSQPDYYIRYNNYIFLFENKDVTIPKEVKASNDVQTIINSVKGKITNKRGEIQLINSIKEIVNKDFSQDNLDYGKKIIIYPIYILQDRLFQTLGLNYKINKWFESKLKLLNIENNIDIKSITIIDINSLILWKNSLKNNHKLFLKILDNNIISMNKDLNLKNCSEEIGRNRILNKYLPISLRKNSVKFPKDDLKNYFDDEFLKHYNNYTT